MIVEAILCGCYPVVIKRPWNDGLWDKFTVEKDNVVDFIKEKIKDPKSHLDTLKGYRKWIVNNLNTDIIVKKIKKEFEV